MDIYAEGWAKANAIRARRAMTALQAFGQQTGQASMLDGSVTVDEDIFREIAGDLLCDLLHLARNNGHLLTLFLEAGLMHFTEEVREEIEEQAEEEAKEAETLPGLPPDLDAAVLDFRNHGIPQIESLIGDCDNGPFRQRIADAVRWHAAFTAALDSFRCTGSPGGPCDCGEPGGCGDVVAAELLAYDQTRAAYEEEAAEILSGIAALHAILPSSSEPDARPNDPDRSSDTAGAADDPRGW
jgi:hypothetical protein